MPRVPTLHVVTHKDELDPERIAGKVVVVLDVLFATTTIAKVLSEGALEVVPMLDEPAARQQAMEETDGSYLLAGENYAQNIRGFGPFAPLALSREAVRDKRIIYVTTNGTVALRRSERAAHVYAACLSNGAAMAAQVCTYHRDGDVIILCAGSVGRFNLEDFVDAGHFLQHVLGTASGHWGLSDCSLAALELYARGEPLEYLRRCRVGRLICEFGLEEELVYASQTDVLDVVPKLTDGVIRAQSSSARS